MKVTAFVVDDKPVARDAGGNLEAELLDGRRVPVSRARAQELSKLGR